MARVTREQVLTALFNLLQSAVGPNLTFKTATRHLKIFDEVPQTDRPALHLAQIKPQIYEANRDGVPPRRTLHVSAFVYTFAEQSDPAPDQQINDILDAFDAAMAPSPLTQTQTLGNLVINAKINGEVEIVPGYLDGDGLLIVPIEILLP